VDSVPLRKTLATWDWKHCNQTIHFPFPSTAVADEARLA